MFERILARSIALFRPLHCLDSNTRSDGSAAGQVASYSTLLWSCRHPFRTAVPTRNRVPCCHSAQEIRGDRCRSATIRGSKQVGRRAGDDFTSTNEIQLCSARARALCDCSYVLCRHMVTWLNTMQPSFCYLLFWSVTRPLTVKS